MTELTTARLRLRQWRDEDLDPFAAMSGDPAVMRFIAGTTTDRERTAQSMERLRAQWREHGFGLWVAEIRCSGEFAGFIGLAIPTFLPEVLPAVEVGWRLARTHWGQGLATEGARASLRYGFENLGLDRIVSIYDPDNHASRRVMDKLGMRWERDTTHPEFGHPVRVLALDRSDWRPG